MSNMNHEHSVTYTEQDTKAFLTRLRTVTGQKITVTVSTGADKADTEIHDTFIAYKHNTGTVEKYAVTELHFENIQVKIVLRDTTNVTITTYETNRLQEILPHQG